MATVRVRKDIWDLGDEANPWRDPAILAYARAVAAMQKVDTTDPRNGASWVNQAAIHERRAASVPGRLENQCQHAELVLPAVAPDVPLPLRADRPLAHARRDRRDVGAAVLELHAGRRAPRAAAGVSPAKKLPDGKPNPLFVAQRSTSFPNINGGEPLPVARRDDARRARRARVHAHDVPGATGGFGGSKTGFSHSGAGLAGPLEITPHGSVHVLVGGDTGYMSSFGTAALDPIFWLHHCNLDRLWERWLRAPRGRPSAGQEPDRPRLAATASSSSSTRSGNRVKLAVKDVLDIEGQLSYTYSGLPRGRRRRRRADGGR